MQTTSKRRSVLLYNPVFIEYGNTTTEFCSLRIYNKICCVITLGVEFFETTHQRKRRETRNEIYFP